ncbi:MAG: hypothetical protein ACFFCW_01905 [Candidatus Hodarchaeota archaeon]
MRGLDGGHKENKKTEEIKKSDYPGITPGYDPKHNHTPGPWRIHAPGELSPTIRDYMITGGVHPDPVTEARYLPIARIFPTKNENPMWRQIEEAEANARLIAAAPETREHLITLAEAVQQIVEGTPDRRDFEHLETEMVRAFDHLEKLAAISKAEKGS